MTPQSPAPPHSRCRTSTVVAAVTERAKAAAALRAILRLLPRRAATFAGVHAAAGGRNRVERVPATAGGGTPVRQVR